MILELPFGWAVISLVAALSGAVHGNDVQRYRLDNGLTVLMAPNRAAPVVALQAWVGVGAADESKDSFGIAHVFEHMLFKGTARRGVGEIAQDVEAAGGEINAWTTFNQTVYHVVLASRYFDTGLDVLADALQNSSFDEYELEREREVILEEIKQGQDDPGRSVAQALFATAYASHPYRRPVIGSAESVRRLTRDRLVDFFRTWYVADNVTLVVTGDFDPDETRGAIERAFGALRSGAVPRRRSREPRQTAGRATIVTHDVREAQLALGFHIPEMRHADTAPLDVLAVALGQGESSRLYGAVRRHRELVNSIYAYAHSLRDPGLFVLGAALQPDNLEAALEAALTETFRLAHREVDEGELVKARRVIEADAIYQEETAQGAARKHGFYELVAGDAGYEQEYLQRVRETTAADVREVAARYLRPDNMSVSALLPIGPGVASEARRERRAKRLLAVADKAAARAAKKYATPVSAVSPHDEIVRDVLPNGIRVIIKRDHSVPVVAMRAVWVGGLRIESARDNGINHLLASMITRGCGDRDAQQIAAEVDDMAGVLSGFSGRNSFGIRSEWLAEDWEAGFGLMAECLLDPTLEHAEFVRERRRVLEELAVREDNPGYVAFRLFAETLYRKHPYRRDVMGSPESVAKLTRKQIADYYRANYSAADMVLAVVGDVDPERVLRRVHETFGDATKRKRRTRKVAQEDSSGESTGPREVYRYLDRQQAHMVVGFPGTTLDDPDRYALEVLTTILSGQGGRLFLELRDKQGLAYRIGAFAVEGIDPGYLAVYIACSPDKLGAAYAGIRDELRKIVAERVSDDELQRAARYLVGTHEISLQRRSAVASAIAFHEVYGLGYDEYSRYAAAVEAVTPADVQRVAAEFVNWDDAVIATVRPEEMTPAAEKRARGVKKKRKRAPARKRRPQ